MIQIIYEVKNINGKPMMLTRMERFEGTELDWNNLSEKDLAEIIKSKEAVHYPELDPEVVFMTEQKIYEATYRFLPNLVFVPEDFNEDILYCKDDDDEDDDDEDYEDIDDYIQAYQIIHRPELKNTIVMMAIDDTSFPAYKDMNGKLEVINPHLVEVITYDHTYLDTLKALDALADAALNIPENRDSNVVVETINVADLENGVWRETADEKED